MTFCREEKVGARQRRSVDEKVFKELKTTIRKSWYNRSLRWIEQLPTSLRESDGCLKSTKKELKAWVKHHLPVRGDRILWGKPLSNDMKKKKSRQGEEGQDDPEGSISHIVVNDLNNQA